MRRREAAIAGLLVVLFRANGGVAEETPGESVLAHRSERYEFECAVPEGFVPREEPLRELQSADGTILRRDLGATTDTPPVILVRMTHWTYPVGGLTDDIATCATDAIAGILLHLDAQMIDTPTVLLSSQHVGVEVDYRRGVLDAQVLSRTRVFCLDDEVVYFGFDALGLPGLSALDDPVGSQFLASCTIRPTTTPADAGERSSQTSVHSEDENPCELARQRFYACVDEYCEGGNEEACRDAENPRREQVRTAADCTPLNRSAATEILEASCADIATMEGWFEGP